ncbi:MAG TPA: hypothetical protein VLE43_18595 [Candidatus Saccharimonadia bacterium]|nr:hypothetical protein [Candidatus Saccharimonadia bacterium]
MKKLAKKALVLLLILAALLTGLGVAGHAWVAGRLKKEALIAQMEEAWDCRVQLEGTELSLWSSPSTVKLVGLKMIPRDDEVEKPLAERAAVKDEDVLVAAREVVLSVELMDLVRGTLKVEKLHLDGVQVKMAIDEYGDSSLDELFESPYEVDEYEEVEVEETLPAPAPVKTGVGIDGNAIPNPPAPAVNPVPVPAPAPSATSPTLPPPAPAPAPPAVPQPTPDPVLTPAAPVGAEPPTSPPSPPAPAAVPPPTTPGASASATATPEGTKVMVKKKKKKKKKKRTKKPINASEIKLNLAIKEISISDGRFENIDLEKGTHITFDKLNVALNDIDIVPTALALHNSCDLLMESAIKVEKTEKKKQVTVADFTVKASGKARPFEVATGLWSPDLKLEILLKKGGLLGGTPLGKQLGKNDSKKVAEYGISLDDVSIGGVLTEDINAKIHVVRGNKIMIDGDTRFAFPQYELTMFDNSWFNAPEDLINARAKLVVSPELTTKILEDAKTVLTKEFGSKTLVDGVVDIIGATLMDEQKRLVIAFRAKGQMSKPDVSLDTVLSDIKDKLKDAGKSFLKGLFDDSGK